MISLHNSRTFRRTLLVTMIAMSTTGCLHDDDDDPVDPPVETNTAPVITSASVDASTEGAAYTYTLAATDADNDTLTLSATTLPAWLAFDAATGALTGTPATTDVGAHDVVLSVTDGTAAAVTQSFTINVTAVVVPNAAPVVTSTSVDTATEGAAYSYTFAATDADGDTLVMSAITLPSWLTFDAATGILTGTPATANVGANPVVLSVTDGEDAQEQAFTITVAAAVVVNTAPTITSTGITTGTVDVAYSYTLAATDAEGDTLSMSSVTLPTWGAFDTATGILSGTPDMADSYDVELMVSDGTDATNQTFTIAVTEASAMTVELVVFENAALPQWAAWVNEGGSSEVVTDDVAHDQATKFTQTVPSVAGFTARAADGAVGGVPFDASGIVSNGMISFELKMLMAPTAGVVDWKFKVEAGSGAQASEVNLSTSVEGHATPVLDTWQTYTFPIATLVDGSTLDASGIDLFMVFPNFGDAAGAEFLLDNFMIISDPNGGNNGGGGELGPELLTNGDFENGLASWKADTGAVVLDGTNNIFEANIETLPGNVFDVNQSQVIPITEGETYTVSFKAKASKVRTMLAGIGLNQDPWTNTTQEPALTTDWQDFSYDIVANFGNANSRVLFDMGGDTGIINIDDVSVKLKGADNGGGGGGDSTSGGSLIIDVTAGIDFEGTEEQQSSWDAFENGSNPPLEFVANPSMVGNTSAQVAKLNLEAAAANQGKFAGAVTRTVTTFKLSTDTVIAKIWVYKDKISPVGIKFERKRGDGYGSHGELTVSNTKINEWEQLTIDFTSQLGLPENDEISGIAIFPDMVDGRTATVAYFDEITFTSN